MIATLLTTTFHAVTNRRLLYNKRLCAGVRIPHILLQVMGHGPIIKFHVLPHAKSTTPSTPESQGIVPGTRKKDLVRHSKQCNGRVENKYYMDRESASRICVPKHVNVLWARGRLSDTTRSVRPEVMEAFKREFYDTTAVRQNEVSNVSGNIFVGRKTDGTRRPAA